MSSIKSTSTSTWKGQWKPEEEFCAVGRGVEGEGKIVKVRN